MNGYRSGQGDEVVSGSVDVEPISAMRAEQPCVYNDLLDAARILERLASDVQEIEFTVEDGKLRLLQARAAERSAQAAVRLALQLRDEGLIDDAETLARVTRRTSKPCCCPPCSPKHVCLQRFWQRACPPARCGNRYGLYRRGRGAGRPRSRGERVILVRDHTRPEDVLGMLAAQGIVTEVGGAASHAAVVSRELGRVGGGGLRRVESRHRWPANRSPSTAPKAKCAKATYACQRGQRTTRRN